MRGPHARTPLLRRAELVEDAREARGEHEAEDVLSAGEELERPLADERDERLAF